MNKNKKLIDPEVFEYPLIRKKRDKLIDAMKTKIENLNEKET